MSSESAEATSTGVETVPSSTPFGSEETPPIDVTSEVGPSSSVVGASVAGPSTSGTDLSARVQETGIAVSSATRARDSASGDATTDVSGMEGAMAADPESSSRNSSQDILEKFAEDWLETLDKEKIKFVSLSICYHLVHMFSFTETMATKHAAAMVKKNDRTVWQWREDVIENDGVFF